MGQTRKSDRPRGMSALPPAADIGRLHAQVRSVPTSDSCTAANSVLFDDLVGSGEQRLRNAEAERFCGLEIDHQLDFS
jgi:hypothetical protein